MEATLVMQYRKSTKGTHVFDAVPTGRPPEVPTIYVKRWAFSGEPPAYVELTVKTHTPPGKEE